MSLPAGEFEDYDKRYAIGGRAAEVERQIALESGLSSPSHSRAPRPRADARGTSPLDMSQEDGSLPLSRDGTEGGGTVSASSGSVDSAVILTSANSTSPSPSRQGSARGSAAEPASGRANDHLPRNSVSPLSGDELSAMPAKRSRVVPPGALKSKQQGSGKKLQVMNRVADAVEGSETGRADSLRAMNQQAERTKEYQTGRFALAERVVAVREREAALEEQNISADQQRKKSESITSRMLQIASSSKSVAEVLKMQREWVEGGGEDMTPSREMGGARGGGGGTGSINGGADVGGEQGE